MSLNKNPLEIHQNIHMRRFLSIQAQHVDNVLIFFILLKIQVQEMLITMPEINKNIMVAVQSHVLSILQQNLALERDLDITHIRLYGELELLVLSITPFFVAELIEWFDTMIVIHVDFYLSIFEQI